MYKLPSRDQTITASRNYSRKPIDLGYTDLKCETLPTGRIYHTPAGKAYPSITSVLRVRNKDKLDDWREAVGEHEATRVGQVAAARGEGVHTLVERYLKNEVIQKQGLMPNVSASFLSLLPELGRIDNIRIQEAPLYSDHLGLAGRVDLIAEFDGKLSIIDIKTSTRVKSREDITSYFIQESAYAIMFEERTGIPITSLVTIMAVDFHKPLIFKEHRDSWSSMLQETIAEFWRQRKAGLI